MISLGRVQPIFKGTYDPNTTYYKLDNVFYNGETWVCKIDSIKGSAPADGSTYWQKVANKGDKGDKGDTGAKGDKGDPGEVTEAELAAELATKAPVIINTASGAVASFPDGADGLPLKSLTAQITPVQSGSGDPSPENVRPISGWTGAVVGHAPERIFDLAVISVGQGSISSSTGAASSSNRLYRIRADYFDVKPSTEYVVCTNLPYFWFYEYAETETTGYTQTNDAWRQTGYRFTTREDTNFLRLSFTKDTSASVAQVHPEDLLYCNVFEVGTGRQIEVDWETEAGTVYDGEIELVSGDLSRKYKAVDMGDLTYYALNDYYYAILPDAVVRPATAQTVPDALCSCYKVVAPNCVSSQTNYDDFACTISVSFDRVLLRDSRYSTAADLKAALAGQTFLYRLAEPQIYQLIGTPIPTLKGQNAIWADTGDVSVNYRADTKLYIDAQIKATRSLIAGIETSMTASKAYSAGDMLIVGDTLYKAATTIASGAALTPGTNVNQTTVAEQLLLLANA